MKLNETIQRQRNKLKDKRSIISKLKKSRTLLKTRISAQNKLQGFNFKSKSSRTLVEMQVLHKTNRAWTLQEKEFAIKLFYKSPAAYKFLRNEEKIVLPSVSTIQKWIGKSKFKPAINSRLLKQIELKTASMTEKEKFCSIVFDEMSIKKFIEYSKVLDVIEGFEDLGHLGRSNELGTQAMVFICRGIYSSWKLPLAYFISKSSMNHNILKEVLCEIVEKVFQAGLIVKCL